MVIPRGRRAVLAGVVALVVAAVAVVVFVVTRTDDTPPAQAGGSPSPVVTSTAATAVATATPSRTVAAPVMPDAAKVKSQKGAEAFFRYFMEVYNYAYAALDERPLEQLSEAGCRYCAGVIGDIRSSRAKHLRFANGLVSIRAVAVAPAATQDEALLVVVIDQTAGVIYGIDGSIVEKSDPVAAQRLDVRLTWATGAWRVGALKVVTSK